FFQAEDGIRDFHVTGVQTCALPIWSESSPAGPIQQGVPRPARYLSSRSSVPRSTLEARERKPDSMGGKLALRGRWGTCFPADAQIGRASCRERWQESAGAVDWSTFG